MLTSDLLRYTIDEKYIKPRYLTRKHADFYLALANDLLSIYQKHVGKSRRELEDVLADYQADWIGYKIVRGLAKMLDGYAEYKPEQEIDYESARRKFFTAVEPFRPVVRRADLVHQNTRELVLEKIKAQIDILPRFLYGDLPENQKLATLNSPPDASELIRRYNLALAQGLLYRCTCMHVWLWDSYKTVFHFLKLARLMHRMQKQDDHFYIQIDGPLALFRKTFKYGTNLARFLPGVLLANRWEMSAEISTEKGVRWFRLNQNSGLVSYYKSADPFDSSIEAAFYASFVKRETEWIIQREADIVDLGDTVLIPDFTFRHPDGRSVNFEIVGFWTPDYLTKKLDKLARANRQDMIVAVNEKLNCSKEDFSGPVIFYKTRVKVSEVLELLAQSATTRNTSA
ncbi:DUF790 family protein [candidate division KSB1 bacterium]|nr:DUF790 family protein [candidate division KSB1 bacterium]RQW01977.1 MAG: DUF790 family protein [candidate division KSB1 bacterium]